jgi:hypothetical protein
MKIGSVLLGSAATVVALAVLLSGEDEGDETPQGDDGEDDKDSPSAGFVESAALAQAAQTLVERASLEDWEEDEPTMGCFYQVRRGDIMLGTGSKSITWRALDRAVTFLRGHGHAVPEDLAYDCELRVAYGELILAGGYNAELFSTWGYGRRAFTGVHGRAIPLGTHHADVRTALECGRQPTRMIPEGNPIQAGTGIAERRTGLCRPYLWLPMIDLDALLGGVVTLDTIMWEDGSTPIDPPQKFMRLLRG